MKEQQIGPSCSRKDCTRLGTFLRHPTVLLVMRVLLGGIFMHAGLMKIRDPEAFGSSLATYGLLSSGLNSIVEFAFPWLEILLGFLLIAGYPQRAPALGSLSLSLLFAAAHGQAMIRGTTVDCGCFGGGHTMSPTVGLALSSALLFSAGWLYCRDLGSD